MFIFLERDSFEANSRNNANETGGRQTQSLFKESAPIRRPYRGIQIKDDTYAVLSVRRPDGTTVPLASSSAIASSPQSTGGLGKVSEYSDFILQSINDQRMEKQQIVETFGDTFVYFFGERPRMVTFSGQLMNTEDFNWRAQFWYNYENYLRGSRLVQLNARCYLAFDTVVIEGYPISATAVDDADNPYSVSFQMTMLMTDYHEFSVIGDMRFPGKKAEGFDVLNQELDQQRQTFLSSTIQVRNYNLHASSSNQIPRTNSALALLRSGISLVNSATTLVGDVLAAGSRLLGGRALRVPIGAASFLQLQAEGELAAASANVVSTASTSFEEATGKRFGTVTVNGVTIPGNKLLVMGPSKFGPSWVSGVTGTSRGMIYENIDEYPTRTQPSSLEELAQNSSDDLAAIQSKAAKRVANMTAFQESLSLYNVFAAQGSILGTIAEVVTAVRSGYGMLLTAANVIRDPLGMVTSAIGVTPQDITRIGEGLKDGAFIPGVSMFVGGAARKTWESWITTVGKAKIGDVFNGLEYSPASGYVRPDAPPSPTAATKEPESKSYESAYGDSDYTPLISSRRTAEADALIAEGQAAETESTADRIEQTLNEVYGNTDSGSGQAASEDAAAIEEVYGQDGSIQKTAYKAEERAKLLAAAQSADSAANDTDTSGITAVDADTAPIAPVI